MLVLLSGESMDLPVGRFLRRDGDHAIGYRVHEYLDFNLDVQLEPSRQIDYIFAYDTIALFYIVFILFEYEIIILCGMLVDMMQN